MELPEKCPQCGSIFIQAESYGLMKIIRCLVSDCYWKITIDPDELTKKQIRNVKNIYLSVTL